MDQQQDFQTLILSAFIKHLMTLEAIYLILNFSDTVFETPKV